MNEQTKSTIGTSGFIVHYPWLFALVVFIGVELSMFLFGFDDFGTQLAEQPMNQILVWGIKLALFLGLAYTFRYLKLRDRA